MADPVSASHAADQDIAPARRGDGSRPRLIAAAALLFGEYLIVSHMVDAMTVARRGGLWRVGAHLGAAGPLTVTTAAAWFMLFRLRPKVPNGARQALPGREAHPSTGDSLSVPRAPWLLAHGLSFASLLFVTDAVFGARVAPDGPAILWLATWCLLAVLVFASVLLGVLGGARWLRVLPRDLRVAGPVGLLAWWGGLLSTAAWRQASSLTLVPVAGLLSSWLSIPSAAVPDSFLLDMERFTLTVSPGCSGYEGFGVFLVLMSVYLHQSRKVLRFPHAWLVLPLGLLLVWAANLIRFAALGCAGFLFGPRVAVASFHSKASWVLFCAIAVMTAGILRRHATCRRPK